MLRVAILTLCFIASLGFLIYIGWISDSIYGLLLVGGLAIWPLLIVASQALNFKDTLALSVVLFTAICYSLWMAYVIAAVEMSTSSTSVISFLFISVYGAPFVFGFWLIAFGREWFSRRARPEVVKIQVAG